MIQNPQMNTDGRQIFLLTGSLNVNLHGGVKFLCIEGHILFICVYLWFENRFPNALPDYYIWDYFTWMG